jgi:hypothetical protein
MLKPSLAGGSGGGAGLICVKSDMLSDMMPGAALWYLRKHEVFQRISDLSVRSAHKMVR